MAVSFHIQEVLLELKPQISSPLVKLMRPLISQCLFVYNRASVFSVSNFEEDEIANLIEIMPKIANNVGSVFLKWAIWLQITNCRNLRSLLPLRFYVKSNLAISGAQKLQFWPFWRPWTFIFEKIPHLKLLKIPQMSKLWAAK